MRPPPQKATIVTRLEHESACNIRTAGSHSSINPALRGVHSLSLSVAKVPSDAIVNIDGHALRPSFTWVMGGYEAILGEALPQQSGLTPTGVWASILSNSASN